MWHSIVIISRCYLLVGGGVSFWIASFSPCPADLVYVCTGLRVLKEWEWGLCHSPNSVEPECVSVRECPTPSRSALLLPGHALLNCVHLLWILIDCLVFSAETNIESVYWIACCMKIMFEMCWCLRRDDVWDVMMRCDDDCNVMTFEMWWCDVWDVMTIVMWWRLRSDDV